jgi:LmbE family N-acetylglucosaminyl deacetylase
MRRKEFAASCEILKVSHGEVLDYPDAGLDRANFFGVVGDLTARIRRIRPHVMITIGPEGAVTAHPDHSMASIFATMAFHWAGRTNRFPDQLKNGLQPHRAQKLYYSTATFALPDRQPVSLSPVTAIIEIGDHADFKLRAFKAHTSQSPLFSLFENSVKKRAGRELFHLAAAITPRQAELETDLFAGVTDD